MPHRFDPSILREYDIRGIVGKTLFAADAHALGRAFAATLAAAGGKRVAVGYDGSGDRIGVVDARGRILWGDQLMVVLARDVLKHYPGAPVLADVKASQ